MMSDSDGEKAFLKLFTGARDDIMAYLYSLTLSHADAEDIFQDVSLLLWEKFGDWRPDGNFRAWARKMAWNKVQNWRRLKSEAVWDPDVIAALDRAFDEEEKERGALADVKAALEHCLARLSAVNRLILHRLYGENNSYKALARFLNRSVRGLKVTSHRVREKVGECVERRLALEKRQA